MTGEDHIFRLLTRGTSITNKSNKNIHKNNKGGREGQREISFSSTSSTSKIKKESIRVRGIQSLHSFKSFKHVKHINRSLYNNIPFKKPTTIQTQSFSAFQTGRDIIAIAPTGSGKTMAYLLGSICHKEEGKNEKKKENDRYHILILTLNKELVCQIFKETLKLTEGIPELTCTISMNKLKKNIKIIISTPETLLKEIENNANNTIKTEDKIENNAINANNSDKTEDNAINAKKSKNDNSVIATLLQSIDIIILDEADSLLSGNYLNSIDSILSFCNPKAQKALFSATMSSEIESIANTFCLDPIRIAVGMPMAATPRIDQQLVYVKDERAKLLALCQMMSLGKIKVPAMIFCHDLSSSRKLYLELSSSVSNLMVAIYQDNNFIMNKRSEEDYNENAKNDPQTMDKSKLLDLLRSNKLWYLIVSDDQLSRGIDVPNLYTVINYAFPISTSSYIHRVGRAGRINFKDELDGSGKGTSITFFTDNDDVKMVANVIRQSGGSVPEWMLMIDRHRKQKKIENKNPKNKKRTLAKYGNK